MANVLSIRFSAFGDVAMLVPVIYSVAKTYPNDRFYILTNKAFVSLFDIGLSNIQIIGIDLKEYKGIDGLLRLARQLKKDSIDYVADTHDVLRSRFLRTYFLLHNKKVRHINKGRAEKKAIITHKAPLHPLKHTIERYRDVFSALGYPFEMQFTSYFDHKCVMDPLPTSLSFDASQKNIGIAPFAKHKGKTYPLEQMEKVIAFLSEKPNLKLYLFGGKDEAEILRIWEEKYPNAIMVFGKTSLKTELALIAQLNVMVSMDSANMHLASLTGTPVISVWGATHPYLGFYGFGQNTQNAVQIELDCRPCSVFGNKPCSRGDLACLNKISPNIIYQKIRVVLNIS